MVALVNPTVTPSDATLGAIVSDVRLASMDAEAAELIRRAFLEHGVLVFPDQHLTEAEQMRFGEWFGRLEHMGALVVSISNRKRDGSLVRDGDDQMKMLVGNEQWHTDSSYMGLSAKASILCALEVPSRDGQTEWADMRAGYDALSDAMKMRIEGLAAYHSLYYSQGKMGLFREKGSEYGYIDGPEPLRPLVKVHPDTGRRNLFIGRHARVIDGWSEAESQALLTELLDLACQPPRIYSHKWAQGDVVIWDNRCVLHRARPYDRREPRVLRHVRVSGEPESETALNYRI